MKPYKEFKLSDPKFLEKVNNDLENHADFEWVTPSGCVFQACGSWGISGKEEDYWIKMSPQTMKETCEKFPSLKVRCSLVARCLQSYSTCLLKNVKLRIY